MGLEIAELIPCRRKFLRLRHSRRRRRRTLHPGQTLRLHSRPSFPRVSGRLFGRHHVFQAPLRRNVGPARSQREDPGIDQAAGDHARPSAPDMEGDRTRDRTAAAATATADLGGQNRHRGGHRAGRRRARAPFAESLRRGHPDGDPLDDRIGKSLRLADETAGLRVPFGLHDDGPTRFAGPGVELSDHRPGIERFCRGRGYMGEAACGCPEKTGADPGELSHIKPRPAALGLGAWACLVPASTFAAKTE